MATTILVAHLLTIATMTMTALETLNAVTLMGNDNAPTLITQGDMEENNLDHVGPDALQSYTSLQRLLRLVFNENKKYEY